VKRSVAFAVGLALWLCCALPATAADRYPGVEWDHLDPAQAGWSTAKLDAAQGWLREIGTSALVIVQHGAIVTSWGDVTENILLNSARKSLLSALIGIAVERHQIALNATIGALGIDDRPPSLSEGEKQATVVELLEARSGVYHGASYETSEMAARRPSRGSHPHGTFWYYNNWDFNALGGIYEHAVGVPVFTAFQQQIARPVGMQDFDPGKCRYVNEGHSNYPAYVFYASARDLARFGLLYLHRGHWHDRQIIPAAWVDDSIKPYSTTDGGGGYGYLWWTTLADQPLVSMHLPAGSYFAVGHGGQYIFVIPSKDMVVVHLARMGAAADSAHREGVGRRQVAPLLAAILEAAGAN
jgi:CubicO group peptidase (beta-lactamase class C family)